MLFLSNVSIKPYTHTHAPTHIRTYSRTHACTFTRALVNIPYTWFHVRVCSSGYSRHGGEDSAGNNSAHGGYARNCCSSDNGYRLSTDDGLRWRISRHYWFSSFRGVCLCCDRWTCSWRNNLVASSTCVMTNAHARRRVCHRVVCSSTTVRAGVIYLTDSPAMVSRADTASCFGGIQVLASPAVQAGVIPLTDNPAVCFWTDTASAVCGLQIVARPTIQAWIMPFTENPAVCSRAETASGVCGLQIVARPTIQAWIMPFTENPAVCSWADTASAVCGLQIVARPTIQAWIMPFTENPAVCSRAHTATGVNRLYVFAAAYVQARVIARANCRIHCSKQHSTSLQRMCSHKSTHTYCIKPYCGCRIVSSREVNILTIPSLIVIIPPSTLVSLKTIIIAQTTIIGLEWIIDVVSQIMYSLEDMSGCFLLNQAKACKYQTHF